ELEALDAITEAVESGTGLPEVVRAAAKALDASLAVTDAWGATLAVAARSPADERALLARASGVEVIPLRVADTVVGALHIRARRKPGVSLRRLLATVIASEVERVRVPDGEDATAARAADAVLRELQSSLAGYTFAIGRSRVTADPSDLARAASEALLAANVAEGGGDGAVLAFEQTGAYRLLLSAMSENPRELQRFYAETVEPLVAYDEQYETDLVGTLEAFLEADGNVAGTAQRLFTHRHTIYYRLERVRELSGHDVSSSDGREKLSLGPKAMRVLGIPSAAGPASELGAEGGRVPRRSSRRS